MASSINATIPIAGADLLAAPIRANFVAAKAEIEALQALAASYIARASLNYFNLTGTSITISGVSDGSTNLVAVNPTTTAVVDTITDNGGSDNGVLRHIDAVTRRYNVTACISLSNGGNENLVLALAKNGTATGVKSVTHTAASGDYTTLSLTGVVTLAQNDTVSLLVGNLSSTATITTHSLSISIHGSV